MEKFHLFAGLDYYASPGLGDYRGAFDSQDEAIANVPSRVDWAVVAKANEQGELEEIWRNYRS